MTTSITYHGGTEAAYPFRVVKDGLWIASVASYSTGDNVLTSLAAAGLPRLCAGCGDLASAELCAACTEDCIIDFTPLDVEFAPVGFLV